jgi:hypothetical protein
VLKSTLQKAKVLHLPSSRILVPSLLYRYKLPDASGVALEVRGRCPCGTLQDGVTTVMAASIRVPLRRGPRPRPPTGGGNEAIKAKELEARWQVALVVSPAEATTSAVGSLTNGGDHLSTNDSSHLSTNDSSHLRTGGLPAMAAASPRTKRSSLSPSYRVRTRPSKNAVVTSTAYDVLYDPPDSVETVRPTARETPRMWQTCARHDRRPCGRRTATPRSATGGSVGGGAKAIQAKEPHTRQLTAPAAGRPRVAEVRLLRKAGEHPSPSNAGGRSGSPAHVEGKTPTQLAFHPSEDDEHP